MNFLDGRIKPIPYFVLGNTRVLRMKLIGSSKILTDVARDKIVHNFDHPCLTEIGYCKMP